MIIAVVCEGWDPQWWIAGYPSEFWRGKISHPGLAWIVLHEGFMMQIGDIGLSNNLHYLLYSPVS